jgi:hypothetical protein
MSIRTLLIPGDYRSVGEFRLFDAAREEDLWESFKFDLMCHKCLDNLVLLKPIVGHFTPRYYPSKCLYYSEYFKRAYCLNCFPNLLAPELVKDYYEFHLNRYRPLFGANAI